MIYISLHHRFQQNYQGMKAMRLLIYVAMMILAAACSGSVGRTPALDAAERLLQEDPSAALEELNAMDVSSMNDSAEMARWAMLYSEAMVAGRLHAPTDTIVDIAIDYYSAHRMEEMARRASQLKALMISPDAGRDRLAESLYLQKEREYWLYRERVHNERRLASLMILVVGALGVIAWQRQRLKLHEMRNAMLVSEAGTLRSELLSHRRERSEIDDRLNAAMTDRFAMLDDLCSTFFESQGTKTERKAIAEKVKEHIDAIKTDTEIFGSMERSVNLCHGEMATLIRTEWPDMKPDDYRLMIYLACGLSSRSIALLVGESVPTVYKRKSRLKCRIDESAMPHRQLFLSVF